MVNRCKSCGAKITWIKTKPNGAWMPVNPGAVRYVEDKAGSIILVDWSTGEVKRARPDIQSEKRGYISHFAICPEAGSHRKKKEDAEQMRLDV